jgi:hypothetical protein
MDNVKKILNTVSDAMAVTLSEFVCEALSDANMTIANEPAGKRSWDLNLMNERGTVKTIGEAPLIDRAMESVIAKLRDAKSGKVAKLTDS